MTSLTFVEDLSRFKWTGSEEDLKAWVEELVDSSIETSKWEEDRHHNLIIFKSKSLVIKWYRSTHTLLVQGSDHEDFKRKLHDKLAERTKEDSDVTLNNADNGDAEGVTDAQSSVTSAETPANRESSDVITTHSDCRYKAVMEEISTLKEAMSAIQIMLETSMQISKQPELSRDSIDSLKKENNRLHEENEQLAACITSLQDQISKIQNERDSLLTAIRLIQDDTGSRYGRPTEDSHPVGDENEWETVRKRRSKKQSESIQNQRNPRRRQGQTRIGPERNESKECTNTQIPKIAILGDSMLQGIIGRKMSKNPSVTVKHFSGSTVEDFKHYIKPTLDRNPDEVIMHVGTNNIKKDSPRDIAEAIVDIARSIVDGTKVTISGLVCRKENPHKVTEVNKILKRFCTQNGWGFIDHSAIQEQCLNRDGVHLNKNGTVSLAKNFIAHLRDTY